MPKPLTRKFQRKDRSYIAKHREWTASAAYKDLKPVARCLIDEFLTICYPYDRNGKLSISVKNAAQLLNCSEKTASKAFHSLHMNGFIVLTKGQIWRERQAREWRLTVMPQACREPTDEWRDWDAEKKILTPNNSISRVQKQGLSGVKTQTAQVDNESTEEKTVAKQGTVLSIINNLA